MRNVLVTGSHGLIGTVLCNQLNKLGVNLTRYSGNLLTMGESLDLTPYDTVFHLAAIVGGIKFNMERPATMFRDNMAMTMNVLEAWRYSPQTKLVVPGSACAYPDYTKDILLSEVHYLFGEPHWTNLPYAMYKRSLCVVLQGYHSQYNVSYAHPILANVYGPTGENIERNHVIPALCKKFLDKTKPVEVFGTGRAVRDYLYIDDAVSALMHAAEHLDCQTVNYGTGQGWTVAQIVDLLQAMTNRKDIVYNGDDALEGQLYRTLDCRLAYNLGWRAQVMLPTGLARTFVALEAEYAS